MASVYVAGPSYREESWDDYATLAYDAATGAQLGVARYDRADRDDLARDVAVSPDGSKIFVTGSSTEADWTSVYATIAYPPTLDQPLWIATHEGSAIRLGVSPDGGSLYVTGSVPEPDGEGSDIGTIRYAAGSGQELGIVTFDGAYEGYGEGDTPVAIAVSPGGDRIYVTGYSLDEWGRAEYGTVAYDDQGNQLWVAPHDPGAVLEDSMTVSPDGSRVFLTGFVSDDVLETYSVTVAYDAATGSALWQAEYHEQGDEQLRAVAVTPDGSRVVVTGDTWVPLTRDYATLAYDSDTGAELWRVRYDGIGAASDSAKDLALSADGTRAYITGVTKANGGGCELPATVAYDAATGSSLWQVIDDTDCHGVGLYQGLALSPGGDRLYLAKESPSKLIAYDADDGSILWSTPVASGGMEAMASSPDGTKIIVTSVWWVDCGLFCSQVDYLTQAYDASNGERLWRVLFGGGVNDYPTAITVSPDSRRVFVTGEMAEDGNSHFGTVALDAETGAELWSDAWGQSPGEDRGRTLAVSPDGSVLYVSGPSRVPITGLDFVTIAYDAATGTRMWVNRHAGTGTGGDVPEAIAVSGDGQSVYVTGRSHGSSFDFLTVSYSPAGTQLWATTYDGPRSGTDFATALAVSLDGSRVYVTGSSVGPGEDEDIATVAYDADTGAFLRVARYDGPGHGYDAPVGLGVTPDGTRLVVAGSSDGDGTKSDFVTIAYAVG